MTTIAATAALRAKGASLLPIGLGAAQPRGAALARLGQQAPDVWEPLPAKPGSQSWIDDFGSILPLIKSLQ